MELRTREATSDCILRAAIEKLASLYERLAMSCQANDEGYGVSCFWCYASQGSYDNLQSTVTDTRQEEYISRDFDEKLARFHGWLFVERKPLECKRSYNTQDVQRRV